MSYQLPVTSYQRESIEKYLNDLSARTPTPGGGSAAALSAAIAASLMSMVVNYTIGKKEYKTVEEKFKALLEKIQTYKNELQSLIDEDVLAYSKLSKSLKEYKDDPIKLDLAFKEATDVPFRICKITAECLPLCKDLAEYSNKNLITDTATAVVMLEGAFFSAKFNVYINMKYIKDLGYLESVHKTLFPLEEEMPKLKEEILHKCEEWISK